MPGLIGRSGRRRRRLGVVGLPLLFALTALVATPLTACRSESSPGAERANPATTTPSTTVTSGAVAARTPPLPADAHVRVAVATLWHAPTSPRPVDAPAVRAPVDIRGWIKSMSLSQKKDLVGRVDSQLLLGDRVVVDAVRDQWAHVTVPGQRSPLDARGYPGWIPLPQLTFDMPARAAREATVVARVAWLTDPGDGQRVMEVSMGTRLPVRSSDAATVSLALPDGTTLRAASSDVVVTAPGAPAIAPSAPSVVTVTRSFEGLPYLWGGTSGFGFDCSGLTHLVHRVHGVVISRDADAQAKEGAPVARDALRPGDLLFYAKRNKPPHHVSMNVDATRMVQSPQTGKTVEIVPMDSKPYAPDYIGARRYIG